MGKWIAKDVTIYPAVPYREGFREIVLQEDHQQALAEKDREIQQIREHEFQRGYQEREAAYQQLMVQRDKLAEDLATTKAWKDDWKLEVMAHHKTQGEYNTLMAQTVRFARGYEECYCAEIGYLNVASKDVCLFHEAQAFLKEREGT